MRPAARKNADAKAIAGPAAERQRGLIPDRNLAQDAVELDACARAFEARAPAVDIVVLLLFQVGAAFPSVCQQFLRMAACAVVLPACILRVMEALYVLRALA